MRSLFQILFGHRPTTPYVDPEERFVTSRLKSYLDNGDYAIINNVLLPSNGNIKTSQIDHIIISIYGIFCIETKSHSGWIFGSRNCRRWTQVLYRSKFPVRNPFLQNYSHIKAIELALGKEKIRVPIISLVVFPSADKIIVEDTDEVGNMDHIIGKILSYDVKKYKYSECQEMIRQILLVNIIDDESRAEHIREVQELIAATSQA